MTESGGARSRGDAPSTAERLGPYLLVALVGGAALLVVVLLALGVAFAVRDGEYGPIALVVLLALVGGPFSLLYLLPAVADPESRAELAEGMPRYERLDAGKAAAAAVLGAASLAVAFAVDPRLLAALLALAFVGGLAASLVAAEWSFDAEERTLTYQGAEGDLDAVTGCRRVDLRGRAVLWPSYADPNDLDDRPRLVVLPSAVADDVLAAVSDEPADAESRPRAERAALLGAGLVFLGLAAGFVAIARGSEDAAALYWLAAFPGFFGALLLYMAA